MNDPQKGLGDVSAAARRQLPVIVGVAAPLLAMITGIALGLPEVFRSTGVVRIEQASGAETRNVDTYAEYYIQTLEAQVRASENLRAWVEEFDLYSSEPDLSLGAKTGALNRDVTTRIVTTAVIDPVSGREREVVTGFEVSYDSRSPELAHNVATAVMDAFLEESRDTRRARGQEQIDFFKAQVADYRWQISVVEEQLAEFKERNSRRLPELLQFNMNALDRIERDLEAAQSQLESLKRERVILQTQLSQIPSTPDETIAQLADVQSEYVRLSSIYNDTHPDVVAIRRQIEQLSRTVDSAAAIPILRQQETELAGALAEARERYSEDHPDVRELMRSLGALRERIEDLSARAREGGAGSSERVATNELYIQLDGQLQSVDTQIIQVNERMGDFLRRRAEYEQILLETPQVERENQELNRDLANVRQLYEETQQELRAAELAFAAVQGATGEQLTIARPPGRPSAPRWPPRAAIIVIGLILATGMGIGVATLREISSGTVRSSADVFELCGGPPISLIPALYNRRRRWTRRLFRAVFAAGVVVIGAVSYVATLLV
jgi:uncharacterized protein involved in exopolysaccharide biosynthesis